MKTKFILSIAISLASVLIGILFYSYYYNFNSLRESEYVSGSDDLFSINQTQKSFPKNTDIFIPAENTVAALTQSVPQKKSPETITSSPADIERESHIPSIEENTLKAGLIADFLQDKGFDNLSKITSSHFYKEHADFEWSMKYEQKIMDFFRKESEFNAFSPNSIECRATKCRAVISTSNAEEMEKIAKLVLDKAYQNDQGIVKNISYVTDDSKYELSFYFERTEEGNITINNQN